jgi:uncharacterized protein YkwD
MKQLLLIALFGMLAFSAGAQTKWADGNYEKVNHQNYRQEPLFNEPINLKSLDVRRLNALLFFMVNEQRAKKGLKLLTYHHSLEIMAYHHSKAMATANFFSHRNPKDAKRRETKDRASLAGIKNPYIAENIAYFWGENTQTYISVAMKLMGQWMASPGHRDNILSSNGLQMGAGVFYTEGKWYGTQAFQWYEKIQEKAGTDKMP